MWCTVVGVPGEQIHAFRIWVEKMDSGNGAVVAAQQEQHEQRGQQEQHEKREQQEQQ